MVPTPLHSPRSSRLFITIFSVLPQHVPALSRRLRGSDGEPTLLHSYVKRASSLSHSSPEFIVFVCLIPTLVLLSGVFAGLTLGYMSLDETQLNVLSMSGTPSVLIITVTFASFLIQYSVSRNATRPRSSPSAKMDICCW